MEEGLLMSQGGRQRKGRSLRHRSAFPGIRSAILERSSQVTTGKCHGTCSPSGLPEGMY